MSEMERLEPDKASYQEELGTFIRTTVANYPRTDNATKLKLTSQANRQFTRQYGVQVNLLMTKLFGAQRNHFGFDEDPELKHFALKIYGKVYEFGPYEEKVRKTMFLDWCADNLAFEFATTTNSDSTNTDNLINNENQMPGKREPVTTYSMKFEHEMDAWVAEYCEKSEPYHASTNNCFEFVKSALDFLDPGPCKDSETQKWLNKYQQKFAPNNQKIVQLPQVESTTSSNTPPSISPISMDTSRPASVEQVDDEEIEFVNLASDDDDYELCEL